MKRLLVGPLLSPEECAPWVTEQEWREAEGFGAWRRRAEFLTWRTMVRKELGREVRIGYDGCGAPRMVGREGFLSVSHCPVRVAVCLSDSPCAVDIEAEERDFGRVADRYMVEAERGLCDERWWPAAVWCAKEALYKYARRKEVDFMRDLRVEAFSASEMSACLPESAPRIVGQIVGRISGVEALSLTVCREEGCLLVYHL